MFFRFSIAVLVLFLALAGCDSGAPSEAELKAPPPEASAAEPPGRPAPPAPANPPAAQDEGPEVVATVNGRPIFRQLLESQVELAAADFSAFGQREGQTEAERKELDHYQRLSALSHLLSLELVSQEAARLGYAPSDEETAREWDELKKAYGQPESLQALLDQYGYSEDDLRGQLGRNLAVKKWRENNFLAQIRVDDREAREFYDQNQESFRHGDLVRVSQIFLSIPLVGSPAQREQARAEARAKGEKALQLINRGIDFGTVAAEMSDDPEAAKNRGDLGWLEKGRPSQIFDPAVLAMAAGQASGLMESPLGYYIYKVTETKPAGLEPFESVRMNIIDYLSEEKLDNILGEKIIELFQQADIQILDPQLKESQARLAPADPAGPANPAGGRPDPASPAP